MTYDVDKLDKDKGRKARNLGQEGLRASRAMWKGNGQGTGGLEEEDRFVETSGDDRK